MRTCTAAFASLLLLALTGVSAFGQRQMYAIKKVSPSVCNSPEYQVTFGPQHPQGKAGSWLEVEVNFQSAVPWTDELTVKYYIMLAGQCLTGEVTHIDIPRGQDLYSVMYVSPRTIARILNGHQLTSNDIQDVGVQLVLKGQVVDTKSFKAAGQLQWWQNVQQVTGKVLNKNQTPFAPMIWDRYEQIKPDTNGQ
ncbi:MAG TPA: Amuc_1102 family pilus-like protein [Chthoniobacteraceae bacterium]|jgi:hypothetical protein|nr:Amuc_1102 family pilus-like protein [Chthoniobacteraceae bacterium]